MKERKQIAHGIILLFQVSTRSRDLKPRANLAIAVIAVAIMVVFAYRSFTRQPAKISPTPTAESCTPEAIRKVSDVLERSILSSRCAKKE
ncbi:entry exclusion lipoprotein TrbK [Herbaspirillum huttiense]|uniref:entry exclusion lipoprotein TrbK n=1 Tax=Herbaspirillum huttiense TaxID=863372 RepID=UPI001065A2C5|nr:entry exclusion lipoprotein TrbK [Herbaspirillum huttiense]QBP76628.1 entry exclusion lipoprotein TrbK [Herbaspirillum huttiense]